MKIPRIVRIGCWVTGATVFAGVAALIFLYAMAMDALSSPEAAPRKRKIDRPRPNGSLLFPDADLVTVPGMPFPRMPEEVARGAIVLHRRFVRPLESLGDTPARGRSRMFLATLHAAVDDVEESERLFREALRILEKNHGTAKDMVAAHIYQGLARLDRGEYAAAVRSFEAAANHAADPELRVVALSNMAAAQFAVGNPAKAERAFLDALDVLRAARQEGTFAHRTVRANLAVFYEQLGDLESARALLEPLVRERGLERVTRVQALNNLAYLYSVRNEFAKAETCFADAEKLTPRRGQWRAAILTNHMMMHNRAGEVDRAEAIGARAYEVLVDAYGKDSAPAAALLTELAMVAMRRGELAKAEQLLARASAIFRKDNFTEFLAVSMRAEALVASGLGQQARANQLSRSALVLAKAHLERILAFGSEMQRLEYLRETSPLDSFASIGDANILADAVLTMKGAVLESLLAERSLARLRSAADRQQFDRINRLKVAIMEKIARGEGGTDTLERQLKREETAFAERLAPHVQRPRGTIDVGSVQAKLAADQVLVEIVRYQTIGVDGDVAAYGGLVISPTGPPVWVPLGGAAAIDERIESIIGRYGSGRGFAPEHHRDDVAVTLRDLHDRVWAPLRQAFSPRTRRVLLSPDGAVCLLPWSVLLDDRKRFVAERWELTQIGSGRDLLRTRRQKPAANTFLALGDGANHLPHSRDEIAAIRDDARLHGWAVTTLLGLQASEGALFRHSRTRILHLATHAGRLQSALPQAVQTRLSKNPMYRGYILLGGGSVTLDAWTRGSMHPFGDDGILTAEEASTLDLRDTWLTVLSACQTGVGDVRAGEGVIGLRRGFALAGAENLVFSLWSVDDDSTADFMKAFYVRLFDTGDVAGAFHATEVAELARWRRLEGIDAAVRRAGAFVLSR